MHVRTGEVAQALDTRLSEAEQEAVAATERCRDVELELAHLQIEAEHRLSELDKTKIDTADWKAEQSEAAELDAGTANAELLIRCAEAADSIQDLLQQLEAARSSGGRAASQQVGTMEAQLRGQLERAYVECMELMNKLTKAPAAAEAFQEMREEREASERSRGSSATRQVVAKQQQVSQAGGHREVAIVEADALSPAAGAPKRQDIEAWAAVAKDWTSRRWQQFNRIAIDSRCSSSLQILLVETLKGPGKGSGSIKGQCLPFVNYSFVEIWAVAPGLFPACICTCPALACVSAPAPSAVCCFQVCKVTCDMGRAAHWCERNTVSVDGSVVVW